MDNSPRCAECGGPLDQGLPWSLCPRCLLQAGLEEGDTLPATEFRCPYCAHPVALSQTMTVRDLACPACGGRFSLVSDGELPRHSLGRFDLLEAVGAGSFGTVWKAWDRELNRTVAIKLPHHRHMALLEMEDFLREARAAAQLKHPGIVSVHEVGNEAGQVYIVSDFIEGAKLDEWIKVHPLTFQQSAQLCAKIAESLHYAHEAGIVHRDLKPSNILVDGQGMPHILDFGLAKRDAGEVNMTFDGKILGTPAYMSPEQARGDSHYADRRSDVYALGVILFELLTGEKPFRGSPRTLLHQVIHEDPPALRRLNSRVPRDLETICLKCLEKEPRKRYDSSLEVAEELRRYLRGEPVLAHPLTNGRRLLRWCWRNPQMASLVAAVLAMLLFLAVAGPLVAMRQTQLAWQEAEARKRALEEIQQTKSIYKQAALFTRRSVAFLADLVEQGPAWSQERRNLADFCNEMAQALNNPRTVQVREATSQEVRGWASRDAIDLARTAVRLLPGEAKYLRTLGIALYRAQDIPEARRTFQASLARTRPDENPAGTYACLALICVEQQEYAEARQWLAKATAAAQQPSEEIADYCLVREDAERRLEQLAVPRP